MSRRGVLVLFTIATSLLLSSCFTGKRPHFNDDPLALGVPTGDSAIDAVLSRLDQVTDGPATAVYTVLTKFGNTTSAATVALDRARRVVEVGDVRYINSGDEQFTCTIEPATENSIDCTPGFVPARISDVGVTIDFYAAEAAARLRRDAQAQLNPAVGYTELIANLDASCVDVTLTGGTATYCVLENGMLAKLNDGDVLITLGLLVTTVDGTKFLPSPT